MSLKAYRAYKKAFKCLEKSQVLLPTLITFARRSRTTRTCTQIVVHQQAINSEAGDGHCDKSRSLAGAFEPASHMS